MKKLLAFTLAFITILVVPSIALGATGDYLYRIPLNVTASANFNDVRKTYTLYDNDVNPDSFNWTQLCDGVFEVYEEDGTTQVPFFVEECVADNYMNISFKGDADTTNDLEFYLYYGNDTATTQEDGYATCSELYEDFPSATYNTTTWNEHGGTFDYDITSGVFQVNTTGSQDALYSDLNFSSSVEALYRTRINSTFKTGGKYVGLLQHLDSIDDYVMTGADLLPNQFGFYSKNDSAVIDRFGTDDLDEWHVHHLWWWNSSASQFEKSHNGTQYYHAEGGGVDMPFVIYREHVEVDWVCVDTLDDKTVTYSWGDEVYLPALEFTVNADEYDAQVYELTGTDYRIEFKFNLSVVNNVTAFLTWDGTDYNATGSSSSDVNNTRTLEYTYDDLTMPFITANATSVNHWWNYTIEYANMTNTTTNTSHSQEIIYAYYLSSATVSKPYVLETDSFTLSASVAEHSALATNTIWLQYNATNYTSSSETLTAPLVTADVNVTFYGWLNTSYASDYRLTNLSDEQKVFDFNVTGCATGYPALNFTVYDEQVGTDITINATVSVNATYQDVNLANGFSYSDVKYFEVCITPNWSEMPQVDVMALYGGTDYSQRVYYLVNHTMTNTTRNISAYALLNTNSSEWEATVINSYGLPEGDTIIELRRWYNDESASKVVAMIRTDLSGKGFTYVEGFDAYYSFLLKQDNVIVLDAYIPTRIISSGKTFEITGEVGTPYWSVSDDLSYSWSFNASGTNILTVTITETTAGVLTAGNLTVYRGGMLANDTHCNSYSTGSSTITLTCATPLVSDTTYYVFAHAITSDVDYLILSEAMRFGAPANVFGFEGLIGVGLITMTLTLVGVATHPILGLLLSGLGLGTGILVGFAPLTLGALLALGIIIIVMVLIL